MEESNKTFVWYIKWLATFCIIAGVVCRSAGPEYQLYDIIFGIVGTALWAWVSLIWQDRALIVLNATMFVILVIGLLKAIA
jgi:nicotinamide riboside transporter PnuC